MRERIPSLVDIGSAAHALARVLFFPGLNGGYFAFGE